MKYFITHYTPLKDRKEHIKKLLNNAEIINYEFIETYDREQLNKDDLLKFSLIFPESLLYIFLELKHIPILKFSIFL